MQNFKILAFFCDCTAWFVSDLARNPNCWFSHAQAHFCYFQDSQENQDNRGLYIKNWNYLPLFTGIALAIISKNRRFLIITALSLIGYLIVAFLYFSNGEYCSLRIRNRKNRGNRKNRKYRKKRGLRISLDV